MNEPVPVLVNAGGGTARAAGERLRERVEAAFAGAGVGIALELLSGHEITRRARYLAGAPTVVVGGGDGTLGSAAGVLAGTETALGILPLGTRNHLAGELGIPADLAAAARLIGERPLRRIDLARVNGRAFVNNACVGFYPAMIRFRDVGGVPEGARLKKLAAIPAALSALKRLRHHRLRLQVHGSDREVVTPMLFVGNNHYRLERGHVGERAALDDGQLSVFAIRGRHRVALLGFAARVLLGRADSERDFVTVADTPELLVAGRSRAVAVAIDGEVVRLAMPLRFTVEPRALTVVAPAA